MLCLSLTLRKALLPKVLIKTIIWPNQATGRCAFVPSAVCKEYLLNCPTCNYYPVQPRLCIPDLVLPGPPSRWGFRGINLAAASLDALQSWTKIRGNVYIALHCLLRCHVNANNLSSAKSSMRPPFPPPPTSAKPRSTFRGHTRFLYCK